MRIPRHILIRILIFGPLFLIFGTRAIITCQNRNEAARAQAEAEAERDALLKQHTRTITMPDGSTREYLELTPESAAQLGFPVEGADPQGHGADVGEARVLVEDPEQGQLVFYARPESVLGRAARFARAQLAAGP